MKLRALSAAALAATALSACESTQDKAARVRAEGARALAGRQGLRIGKPNRDVKILGRTILADKNGYAVVVELENRGRRDEAGLPIAIRLDDAKGRKVFANDAPGLEPALVSMPLLRRGKPSFWIHNQVLPSGRPRKLDVVVGQARSTDVPAAPPHITLSKVRLDRDSDGYFATGIVHNRSKVLQRRLTIFCVSRKGGKVIAAGRGVIDKLPPGEPRKPIRFSVYFIGNPAGGTLDFEVPPVALR